MLAHGVDLVNRRAAGDQQAIELLNVFERDIRKERLLGQRRAAPGEQKENKRARVAAGQQIQNRAACGKAARVRHRMPREDRTQARQLARRRGGRGHNALSAKIRREHVEQPLRHGKRGFADGRHTHALELREVDLRFPAPDPAAGARELAAQRCGDINRRKRFEENLPGELFERKQGRSS